MQIKMLTKNVRRCSTKLLPIEAKAVFETYLAIYSTPRLTNSLNRQTTQDSRPNNPKSGHKILNLIIFFK